MKLMESFNEKCYTKKLVRINEEERCLIICELAIGDSDQQLFGQSLKKWDYDEKKVDLLLTKWWIETDWGQPVVF